MSKRRALSERLIALRDTKRAKASEQTVNESALFAKLNYDVRCVIYDHLYEYLPPLARKWHANGVPQDDCCQGIILSCKLANMELLDAAGRHWKTYLNGFQEEFETYYGKPITILREIPLQPGWGALRSVMLSVAVKYMPSRKDQPPGFQHRLDIDVRIRSPIDPLRRLLE
ncbi:hypothetical protein SLS60_004511 [Paraconiothyrium brasiliense]|uniref:Uncharacterized protein n=1 Tax=Paraconiothyrium brasiliense TaxID=300254 RepID=A0ABR3RKJ9_9PLEO